MASICRSRKHCEFRTLINALFLRLALYGVGDRDNNPVDINKKSVSLDQYFYSTCLVNAELGNNIVTYQAKKATAEMLRRNIAIYVDFIATLCVLHEVSTNSYLIVSSQFQTILKNDQTAQELFTC